MKTEHCIDAMSSATADSAFGVPPLVRRVAGHLALWAARQRQRRQLARLSDAMLKDIGLTRADIGVEIEKPFWRP